MPGSIPVPYPSSFNNWKKKENMGSQMGHTKKKFFNQKKATKATNHLRWLMFYFCCCCNKDSCSIFAVVVIKAVFVTDRQRKPLYIIIASLVKKNTFYRTTKLASINNLQWKLRIFINNKTISFYLNFLSLIVDDGLLLFDRILQRFVPLQKSFAKFCRQLEIWNKIKNFENTLSYLSTVPVA